MSTATRARVNNRSAVLRRSRSGRALTRYRSPVACTRRRTASSACVSRLRLPCMVFRAAALEAHGVYMLRGYGLVVNGSPVGADYDALEEGRVARSPPDEEAAKVEGRVSATSLQ